MKSPAYPKTTVTAALGPMDVERLDALCRRTDRSRPEMLRVLVRVARIRGEPDVDVELASWKTLNVPAQEATV